MNKKYFFTGSVILSIGTFASYILGAIRDIVFGNFFGISGLTDSYLSAFLLADILMMIFVSSALLGLTTPLYLREKQKNKTLSRKIFGNFFSSLLLVFTGVLIIAGIFAPSILPFISPEIFAQYPKEFVLMGRLFLFSNFLFAISNFLGTFLMAHRNFISTSVAPLFYNIGIIGGILVFANEYGILSAGYGAVFGAFLHMFTRIIEYFWSIHRKKISGFSLYLNFSDPLLRELVISMLWKIGGLIIVPLTFLFFVRISAEQTGLYTAFQYMRNLQSAGVAIFGISLATAVFPLLSQNSAEENSTVFSQNFWRVFGNIFYWTLPLSIGIFFLGSEIISLLYGIEKNSLAFEWIQIFGIYLSGILVFESFFHLLSRSFYASKDIATPLLGGIIFIITSLGTLYFGKIFFPKNLVWFVGGSYFLGYFFQTIFLFIQGYTKKIFSSKIPAEVKEKIYSTFLWSFVMGNFLFISSLFPEIFWIFQLSFSNIFYLSVFATAIYFTPKIFLFFKGLF